MPLFAGVNDVNCQAKYADMDILLTFSSKNKYLEALCQEEVKQNVLNDTLKSNYGLEGLEYHCGIVQSILTRVFLHFALASSDVTAVKR